MAATHARRAWAGPAIVAAVLIIGGMLGADVRAQSLEQHDTSLPIEITADSLEVMQDTYFPAGVQLSREAQAIVDRANSRLRTRRAGTLSSR